MNRSSSERFGKIFSEEALKNDEFADANTIYSLSTKGLYKHVSPKCRTPKPQHLTGKKLVKRTVEVYQLT